MASASTQTSEKPMSQKQQLKLEKKQDGSAIDLKNWVEETPAGQRKILSPLNDTLHKAYIPKVVESAWYSFWEEQGLFKPRTEEDGGLKPRGKYVIAIPSPNVTGKLHIGHALALSLEDTLIRWHRMRQFSTLYIPGCDYACIATQAVVEKRLARYPVNGKSKRQDFTRAEFVQLCQDWKEDYHREINKTTRRLGVSVDWSREAFTESAAVESDQKELEGSTKLSVPGYDKKIEFGTLTYFKYPIEGSDQAIEVATTRPETMLGDTGIAVHPQDERYEHLVGKTAQHPIIPGRKLRIIADEYVERGFGTGAVKLTPAHDYNDFTLGRKHNLTFINILNEDKSLNSNAGHYAGEKRFDARYRVIEELKTLGLYTKQEPNKMVVPICSRSGDIVEPLLKPQWWMKMEPLTKPAIEVVERGELVIRPELQQRNYLQWMRNFQDWCLSRQLWWGHQIPAYHITIDGEDEAQEKAEAKFPCKKVTLKRDADVLDTWFSAALWPFSTLGWPDKTSEDLKNYFPTTTFETGWDILPFWVSRMIMFSLKLTGQVPFTEVFCHGLIRDSDGRKMSKSLGNVIDPIDILDGISLDDLHQKLLEGNLAENEVKMAKRYQKKAFPQGIPEGYRRLCNKIYQATKYVLGKLGDEFVPRASNALTGKESLPEKWILSKLNTAAKQINQVLEEREFARSTQIIHQYLYDNLFDIYIENSKVIIADGMPEEARSAMDTLYTTLESGLRLLSPFMPFLTEELWQRLPRRSGDNTASITIAEYPEYDSSFDDPRSEAAYELVLGCSKGVRSLIVDYPVKDKGVVYIAPLNQSSHHTVSAQLSAIKSLSGKTPLEISILDIREVGPPPCAVFPVSADANVYHEIEGRMQDARAEAERFKTKLDEARKDGEDIDLLRLELGKVQDKDVSEAMQAAESRKRDVEARLQALEETVAMFEMLII
ncbi:hypothetical protein BDV12DRAFT_197758 [Aspergillus spectabilis]